MSLRLFIACGLSERSSVYRAGATPVYCERGHSPLIGYFALGSATGADLRHGITLAFWYSLGQLTIYVTYVRKLRHLHFFVTNNLILVLPCLIHLLILCAFVCVFYRV